MEVQETSVSNKHRKRYEHALVRINKLRGK